MIPKVIKKIRSLIDKKFTGKLIISFNQGIINHKIKIEISEDLECSL